MTPAWCGVDVGTQGVRAVVLDADGRVAGEGAAPIRGDRREERGGLVSHRQDPRSWWDALVPAVRDAVAAASAAGAGPVEALALDATSGTVLVERADGAAAGPALMYDDTTAAGVLDDVLGAGAAHFAEQGYRMQRSWALPKVVHLLRAGAVGRGCRVVHQGDHLLGRLAGGPVATDTSTALKTGVDLHRAAWPTQVLAALDVPVGVLPDVVLPGVPIGTVSPDAAAATGLPAGARVVAGTTDGCAAQIAAGALDPAVWSSALGTTLVVKGTTEQLLDDPTGAVYSHRHPDGGWLPGGASNTGTSALAAAFGADGVDFADLTRRAAPELDAVAAVAPLYPLHGAGERFPFDAPGARALLPDAWLDGRPDPDAARFAALCLGVAFVERLCFDVLAGLGAARPEEVVLTGGATANAWWNQVRADVLGVPTVLPSSPQAAVGMAVLAAAPPGRLTATARRLVRRARVVEPDAARHAALTPAYEATVAALREAGWLEATVAAS